MKPLLRVIIALLVAIAALTSCTAQSYSPKHAAPPPVPSASALFNNDGYLCHAYLHPDKTGITVTPKLITVNVTVGCADALTAYKLNLKLLRVHNGRTIIASQQQYTIPPPMLPAEATYTFSLRCGPDIYYLVGSISGRGSTNVPFAPANGVGKQVKVSYRDCS